MIATCITIVVAIPPSGSAQEPSTAAAPAPGPAAECAASHPVRPEVPGTYGFLDGSSAIKDGIESNISWGSAWADHDRDGLPDLLVGRHYRNPKFLSNRCDQLVNDDSFEPWGFGDRHNCAWGEANGDGLIDLFCTQGGERGKGARANNLYIQQPDGTFIDEAKQRRVDYAPARSRAVSWIDYDTDGDLDIFIAAQWRKGYPDRMFRNDGGIFTRTNVGLESIVSSETVAWSDLDHDGDPDLLMTLKNHRARYFENRGGRFKRIALRPFTGHEYLSVTAADLTGDGWDDLVAVGGGYTVIMKNRGGSFVVTRRVGAKLGRMATPFDVDNDGDLDLYVVRGAAGNGSQQTTDLADKLLVNVNGAFVPTGHGHREPKDGSGDAASASDWDRDGTVDLFLSNGYKKRSGSFILLDNVSDAGNWAGLYLNGGARNPLGFGVRVKIGRGKRSFWLTQNDGVAFRTQSEVGYLHIGMGGADGRRVQVRWPSGAKDCGTAKAGTMISITRGSGGC